MNFQTVILVIAGAIALYLIFQVVRKRTVFDGMRLRRYKKLSALFALLAAPTIVVNLLWFRTDWIWYLVLEMIVAAVPLLWSVVTKKPWQPKDYS